jgi:hypothetical protein
MIGGQSDAGCRLRTFVRPGDRIVWEGGLALRARWRVVSPAPAGPGGHPGHGWPQPRSMPDATAPRRRL